MGDEWISARRAMEIATQTVTAETAQKYIADSASLGLIEVRAAEMVIGDTIQWDVKIPKDFWVGLARRPFHFDQWQTGRFVAEIDEGRTSSIEGMTFREAEIEALVRSIPTKEAEPRPGSRRGRQPADWWDNLWVEMCRQNHAGILKRGKQKDVEAAMSRWLGDRGLRAAPSTIRIRAGKLYRALKAEDENETG